MQKHRAKNKKTIVIADLTGNDKYMIIKNKKLFFFMLTNTEKQQAQ